MLSTIKNSYSLDSSTPLPILDISNLVERTFLMPANKNQQYLQVRIVKTTED